MAERIESRTILGPNEVANVHVQTGWERFVATLPSLLRPLVAIGLLMGGAYVAVAILFTTQQNLLEYRTGAWALISGVVGSSVTYLFGDYWKTPS